VAGRSVKNDSRFGPKRLQSYLEATEAFALLLDLLARLSTRGEQCSHAGSLDLLRDAYVEGASAPPELGRFARNLSIASPKRPRRVRPTDATHIFKDEHPCALQ
jgi:hypothetical protein